jgi:hypothetical protein
MRAKFLRSVKPRRFLGPVLGITAQVSGKGAVMGFFEDVYSGGRSTLDMLGIGEAFSIAKGAKDWIPGAGFSEGADKFLGPLGNAVSLFDVGNGAHQLWKGLSAGPDSASSDLSIMGGIHDVIGGGAGLLGNLPGPAGAVAKAFSAGYAVGDFIAPHIFGSEEEDNKPKVIEADHDHVFKPSTGNKWVDKGLDIFGIRD